MVQMVGEDFKKFQELKEFSAESGTVAYVMIYEGLLRLGKVYEGVGRSKKVQDQEG